MLQKLLREKIEKQGAISIAEYMEACLYHPEYGYYMTRDPFGKNGDFTTAPEISQLFGEMLALWVFATWQKLGGAEKFNFVECGPGRGTCMSDMLRTLRKIAPQCFDAATVQLVEISPFLQKVQQKTLSQFEGVTWHSSIEKIDFTLPTILIGNELLDAFPVQQFTLKEEEKCIITNGDKFAFTHEEEVIEKSPAMDSFLTTLSHKMQQGAVLFIDYGYTDEGRYSLRHPELDSRHPELDSGSKAVRPPIQEQPQTNGDTLQAIQRHQFVGVLENPGEADLTTHVNFSHVQKVLGEENTSIIPLATFLITLGLPVRAADLIEKQPLRQQEVEDAVYRLLHAEQMGGMFKVLTKIF